MPSTKKFDMVYLAKKLSLQLQIFIHPTSQEIIQILKTQGKKTVTEIQYHLKQSQSLVSQRLAKMRKTGLLKMEKQSRNVFYFVNEVKTLELSNLLKKYFKIDD